MSNASYKGLSTIYLLKTGDAEITFFFPNSMEAFIKTKTIAKLVASATGIYTEYCIILKHFAFLE